MFRNLRVGTLAPFAQRLMRVAETKFNRHLYDGRVEGYGIVLDTLPVAPWFALYCKLVDQFRRSA